MVEKIRDSYIEVLRGRGINFEIDLHTVPIQSLYATKDSVNNKDFEKVLKSIEGGILHAPILVQQCCKEGKEGAIIDGHARALAYRKLGKRKIDAWVIFCKEDKILTENLGKVGFKKVYQVSIK